MGHQKRLNDVWAGSVRNPYLGDEREYPGVKQIITLAGIQAGINIEDSPLPEIARVIEDDSSPQPA